MLKPDIGSAPRLSGSEITTWQPVDGVPSSSIVRQRISCGVEGCNRRFSPGMDEDTARTTHNYLYHVLVRPDELQIPRSHLPGPVGEKQDGHPSETPDFW